MEKLMILPYQVDNEKWTSIIRRHLQTAKTEEVEVAADFGTGAQLLREIAKFFDKRRDRTEDKDAVAMGRVYEEAGWLFFKASALESFIVDLNKITGVTSPMIREKIQELGGVMTEEGYWRVEEERLPKLTQKEIEVNYKDVEGYDNAEYGF